MSEREYDKAGFYGEIVDVKFRGFPSPPLDLVVELCLAMHAWLSNEDNHVFVHCYHGYSRSAILVGCYLTWIGRFESVVDALDYIGAELRLPIDIALLPSQRRYLMYFEHIRAGTFPEASPITLTKVILSSCPDFSSEDPASPIFKPVLEMWQNGKMIYKTNQEDEYYSAEEVVVLPCNFVIKGDVLLRVRHILPNNHRCSAFRVSFHSHWASQGSFHFTRSELDGACEDQRFPEDFFADVLFQSEETFGGSVDDEAKRKSFYDKARETFDRKRDTLNMDTKSITNDTNTKVVKTKEYDLSKEDPESPPELQPFADDNLSIEELYGLDDKVWASCGKNMEGSVLNKVEKLEVEKPEGIPPSPTLYASPDKDKNLSSDSDQAPLLQPLEPITIKQETKQSNKTNSSRLGSLMAPLEEEDEEFIEF